MLEFKFPYGGEKIYAIVETGGKQYKVTPKQTIEVERLGIPEDAVVELDKVLLGKVMLKNTYFGTLSQNLF